MLQKRLAELQQRRISEELREECLPYHLRTGSGKTLAMQIDDADKEIARCQVCARDRRPAHWNADLTSRDTPSPRHPPPSPPLTSRGHFCWMVISSF